MNAIKLEVIVPENRQLTITLPSEILPGKAEVIILTESSSAAPRGSWERMRAFLTQTPPAQPGRTKEEIDQFVAEERASWEDHE